MNRLEMLMSAYPNIDFEFDKNMPTDDGGLNVGSRIIINSGIPEYEQYQWLCEELGHHATSAGDISNYGSIEAMRQEKRARRWGYTHYLSRSDLNRLRREYASEESDYPAADDVGVQVTYLHEVGRTYGFDFKHARD